MSSIDSSGMSPAGAGAARILGLDGLRALAVLAVIAFHADLAWARGGFLGVDAFFVISGFVITRSMLDEHRREGALDLARFWSRRLARLLPALLLLVGVLTAYVCVRRVDDLPDFRGDAISALLYVSNWRFWAGGDGYFASTHGPSLLQHTWSLAVEEQFYLVWPLVAALAFRRGRPRSRLLAFAVGGAAASMALQIGLAVAGAGAGRIYFGSDTRAQSLLVGAGVACLLTDVAAGPISRRWRSTMHGAAGAGLATTALLWWAADGRSPWLNRGGFAVAALAVAGVIPSVTLVPEGVIAKVLSVEPLRWLGRISYGVYLWHWPVQLTLTHSATGLRGSALILVRFVITVATAAASYYVLELPVRRRTAPALLRIARLTALSVGVAGAVTIAASLATPTISSTSDEGIGVAALSASPLANGAVPEPLPAASPVPPPAPPPATAPHVVAAATAPIAPAPTTEPRPAATTTPRSPPSHSSPPPTPVYRVAVLGDSVAQSVARGLIPVSSQYGLQVLDDAVLGCGVTPSGGYRLAGKEHGLAVECEGWEQTWNDRLHRDTPEVVLVQLGRHEVLDRQFQGRWTDIFDAEFAAYVTGQVDQSLVVAGRSGAAIVVLTAPYYRGAERPDGGQWPENDPLRVDRFNDIVREVAARHPEVLLVDLGRRTNPSGRFTATMDGVRMRRDGVHYTVQACRWFAPWLVPQVRQIAGGT